MSISVTGKLNKPAQMFQAGDSTTGFGVRLGVQTYNRKIKDKEWTNYSAAIFSNNQTQIGFLQSALVEGAVIEISGTGLLVETFDGQNGQVITLQIQDAKLGYIGTPNQQQNQQQQNNGGYQQQQQNSQQNNQQQSNNGQTNHLQGNANQFDNIPF